ncbi:glycosyltransferase family 39 protein [Pontibacter sp. E15-1]|uniref:glycosyltransferase family 39 protein n=1 Tax=Pontibacter sp. E15-1 TaxID=2919918 RepID=UPI001F4F38C2|nr:glycosyltransferase family 39 protein [Pontibacter sp. E15-1]MCJ8165542.1 glycosyltransferase family 39 protein [Pontibacter sp. E15-1]
MPAPYRVFYWSLYFILKAGFMLSGYNLFSEEAQYWLWSKRLDWAYYSKPPLIAWVNFGTTSLLGDQEWVIRATALALGAATLFVFYKVSMQLFANKQLAHLATMLLSVMPFFVLASTFFTTDSLVLLFWVSTFYFFLKALQHNSPWFWVATGISFGLGCLSKQAMLFFVVPLLLPLFWHNGKRYLKGQAIVLVLVLVFHLPLLWWNYQHDWIMVRHLMNLAGAEQQVQFSKALKQLGELFGGFILINSPFFFPLLLRTFFFGQQPYPKADKQKLGLLLAPAMGILLFFTFVALSKRVEVNWYNVGCVLLPIGMAYALIESKKLIGTQLAFGFTATCLLLFLYPVLQDYSGINRVLPVRSDAMKRLIGWQMLGQGVQKITDEHPELAPFQVVAVDYHVAAELAFYTGNTDVRCLTNIRQPNQFTVWAANGWGQQPANTLFVTDNPTLPPEVQLYYDTIKTRQVPFIYRGHHLYTYTIYVLRVKPGVLAGGL